jgi:ketosteroid isomerase-like protein
MSQENVEAVRRAVDAFNVRDRERVYELLDPEVEFHSALIEKKTYRGHAGLAQYRADLDAVFETWNTEDDQIRDAGGDRVLHLYRIVGRGRGSGVPVETEIAILWRLRDGKLVEGHVYLDQDEALTAAGLEP